MKIKMTKTELGFDWFKALVTKRRPSGKRVAFGQQALYLGNSQHCCLGVLYRVAEDLSVDPQATMIHEETELSDIGDEGCFLAEHMGLYRTTDDVTMEAKIAGENDSSIATTWPLPAIYATLTAKAKARVRRELEWSPE